MGAAETRAALGMETALRECVCVCVLCVCIVCVCVLCVFVNSHIPHLQLLLVIKAPTPSLDQ